MSCTYSGSFSETVYTMELHKSDNSDDALVSVLLSSGNITIDSNWETRLTVEGPSLSSPATTTVRFSELKCDNDATYQWKVVYFDAGAKDMTSDVNIIVKVKPTFSPADGKNVTITPATNLKQDDEVTFTCEGDIGKNDYGQIIWFYFLQGSSTAVPITTGITSGPLEEINGDNQCSYRRTSTLKLTLQRTMNNFLVRCTVQQDITTAEGDGYKQTSDIPVQYWPEEPTITKNPPKVSYTEGQDTLKLTCAADSNPTSSYHWILPNTNVTHDGPELNFTSLTVEDTGTYICVAQNTINTLVYSANNSVLISVVETTTAPPTTTPAVTSPGTKDNNGTGGVTKPSTGGDDGNNTTTVIIVVVVIAFVIIVVLVVVFVVLRMKKKPKEIEEPPEKPRNNQDLNTFYGNRPDLVSSDHMKNNTALNSSFNNSFDSTSDMKSRNEDGLLYIDLQFDDRPRSRRPIQVYDNGSNGNPAYADIAMPRV